MASGSSRATTARPKDPIDNRSFLSIDPEYKSPANVLTADQIASFNLPAVQLVVLSGCETGKGIWESGEGMASMQRAFHVAGAKTVVSSLWSVPDDATTKLMDRFYLHLISQKMPASEALRQAKIWMIEQPSSSKWSRAWYTQLPVQTVACR